MVTKILPALTVIVLLSSCAAFKPLNFTSNKQVATIAPSASAPSKFIDEISVTAPTSGEKTQMRTEPKVVSIVAAEKGVNIVETSETSIVASAGEEEISRILAARNRSATAGATIEDANTVQLKYAVLMKTEVENLPSKNLLETVDQWYGVRYRTGGNTKSGVDCSGFTCAVYSSLYGYTLPRVSREQYRISRKLSIPELEEGDLVFFSMHGRGVSHVGVYLGNNKFIHASVSRGVMVNDLSETYYKVRYYGAGRIEDRQVATND
jgi:cell wall-associated NlpC family hydrolase